MQEILAFTALAISLFYLVKKTFLKTKKKSSSNCASDGCGCH
jgi:hypothetical protein